MRFEARDARPKLKEMCRLRWEVPRPIENGLEGRAAIQRKRIHVRAGHGPASGLAVINDGLANDGGDTTVAIRVLTPTRWFRCVLTVYT